MKKTRQILSIVLAVLFVFSSMPVVYVNTAAADAVALAAEETGTLENPTRPVEATGSFAFDDLVKITIEVFNTDYTFYQTKDEEYFALAQSYYLQKVNADNITVKFESVGLWEQKTSDMTNPDSTELEWRGNEDDGLWEIPGVKDNRTDLFRQNHLVSEGWEPTTSASQGITSFPFNMPEDSRYAWNYNLVFKGNSGDLTGEHHTNYYQQLKWRWDANDGSDFAKVDVRLQTRIRVLDAREFVVELARLQNIVDNPENYTDAYVSSAQAILNDIPDDLENLTAVYDQSVIDAHVEAMRALSLNAADYTEYNRLYTQLASITNAKGAYTDKSYATFQDEIARINGNLSKSLDKTQQATVDAAVEALKKAFAGLVTTDLTNKTSSEPDWTSRDKGYGKVQAEIDQTSYKFMQTRDYQKFQFDQRFFIRRYGGNNSSRFYGLYFEENYPTCGSSTCAGDTSLTNGTTQFLNLMDQSMLTSITAKDENGTSITAKEFNQWIWDGSVTNAGDSIVSNGLLTHDFKLAKGGFLGTGEFLSYAADSSPVFYGRVAGDYGEIDLTYVYRLGYMYDSSDYAWTNESYYHWHIPTTIEVTDVRQLISAVDQSNAIIADADNYSDAYIANLKAAIAGIPMEMLRGVEYYEQAEVDALYNQVNSVLNAGEEGAEGFADYSEYSELLEKLMAVDNQSRYTEESFAVFEEEVYTINKNLSKTLPASEQAQVDAAVDALRAAYAKLEFYEVGNDNSFSSDELADNLGNSTLDFEVSNTEYTFMQTYDGQKFALETKLYLESTNDNYDTFIYGLQYSMVKAGDTTCQDRETPDAGCHNLESVVVPEGVAFTDGFLNVVIEGVEKAAKDANGAYIQASDGTGTIGRNTTWVFDKENSKGSSFISNGLISYGAKITTDPHYATSNIICNGFSGGASGDATGFEAVYSWRLGWGYREKHVLDNLVNLSTTVNRHVHIPVTVKLTDARALNSLYEQACNILKGKSDVSYTLETLLKLNEACKATPQDMVYGDKYYTQDAVNTEYAKLYAAFEQLETGADYSEYFDAYVKAEEIINSNNSDSRGNALYDEEAYAEFVETVKTVDDNLDKKLLATEENQATIDKATQAIIDAITDLEETKRADYSDLNDAMTEAEKILNAPEGTYTDETLDAVQKAYDDAVALDKELPASEQEQVDAVADALKEAVDNKDYKADYSEFEEAYDKVQNIVNNPDDYTEQNVQDAKDALEEADKLDRDLPDTAENREKIKNATDALDEMLSTVEGRADYTTYNLYMDIALNVDKNAYTKSSYDTFMAEVKAIDDGLSKNLPASKQHIVTEAENALVDAYNKLLGATTDPGSTGDSFTNEDVADAYNGAFKFSVASTSYNFVQTVNDEKIRIKTDLVVNNADTAGYTINLESLKISCLEPNELVSEPTGNTCLNSDVVTVNQAKKLFCKEYVDAGVVTGVVMYSADTNGDMAHHTTWVNNSGNSLSTDGLLNSSTTITEESSASADYIYKITGDSERSYTYILRLGWAETDNATGTTTRYHAHIPVTLNMTDAKELYSLYNSVEQTVTAGNDGTYTDESFTALENAFNNVNTDIFMGNEYFTQAEVDEELAKLKAANDALSEKADYTDFDKAYEQIEEIVNNPDNYTKETVDAAQQAKDVADTISKDLPASEQGTIDSITDAMNQVIENKQEKADYTDFDKAYEQIEEIVNNPDKYTQATVDAAQQAKDVADTISKELPASEQGTIDSITDAMNQVIANKQEKADYTDFNNAYEQIEEIVNNPDKYTQATVDAAQQVKDVADAISKDLPSSEQGTIDSITNAMNQVIANKQEKADYTGFDAVVDALEEIVNNPDKYTDETVQAAKDALEEAEKVSDDLPASAQDQLDEVTEKLQQVVDAAQERADYTDYNNAKTEADNLVNDDGNGNPIYDEEAFQQYKDKVAEVDNALDKNLPSDYQTTVDEAAQALKDLRTELDATKGHEESVIDPETTVDSLKDKVIEEGGYNPDEVIVEFRNYLGEELAGEAFVGTGSTMRVILKSTGELLEYKLFIVMGDVDGDGDVDGNDYQKAMNVGLKKETYAEEHSYFFTANDMSGDSYIDVLDCALIRRMF